MAVEEPSGSTTSTKRLRAYPPLAAVAFALLLIFALPSALNLPQSNPTETLEYAPVPPDEDRPPPPSGGSFASLGLGTSSSISGEEGLGGGGGASFAGAGRTASTKRCVGNPPRQTEDPLSPPCVAHFEGNNGGATYQGVTKNEIRILIFVETGSGPNWQGNQRDGPETVYKDMNDPDTPDMWYQDRYIKTWQKYFNERYQTYDRKVHFWAYYAGWDSFGSTPEARRAQAADNYARIKPFAVVFDSTPTNFDAYQEVISKRGVLTFTNTLGLAQGSLQRFPKLAWGFLPSDVEMARIFGNYLCDKVVPNPVSSFSGNGDVGRPRKYGLVYTASANRADYRRIKDYMKSYVSQNCGLQFNPDLEKTYPRDGIESDNQGVDPAIDTIRKFQDEKVTTIIWPLGYETNLSKTAEQLRYFPEWIIAGDYSNDGSWQGSFQSQEAFHRHAINLTTTAVERPINTSPLCEQAYVEYDPTLPRDGLDFAQACHFYPGLRSLFTGIQTAGPRLGPTTLDRGLRAIPKVVSTNPTNQTCFFTPGDSTCVKDSQITWWDRVGDEGRAGEISGCWRMARGGQRYLPGAWPAGNIDATINFSTDPCNGHVGGNPGHGGLS